MVKKVSSEKSTVDFIELYEATDGWRWRAKSNNGEIVSHGEEHPHGMSDARRAAEGVHPGVPIRDEDGKVITE